MSLAIDTSKGAQHCKNHKEFSAKTLKTTRSDKGTIEQAAEQCNKSIINESCSKIIILLDYLYYLNTKKNNVE